MSLRSLIPRFLAFRFRYPVPREVPRAALLLSLLASIGLSTGCERVKAAVGGGGPAWVDPWQTDSILLASSTPLLFRVIKHDKGIAVAPLGSLGKGLRRFNMTTRGWKAFDLQYLHEGHTLQAVEDGLVSGVVQMDRGFWTGEGRLDSIPIKGCNVPAGLGKVRAGVTLAVTDYRPKLNPVTPLSEAELATALSKIPTLIAPSQGIPRSLLGRYQRDVHVLNTGINSRPSILVRYNDPEVVSDSADPSVERPRQLILILDPGTYGYRPSFTFKTIGNLKDNKRMAFLDYLDVDSDGKAEIFFEFQHRQLTTTHDDVVGFRSEGEGWRVFFQANVRCAG